MNISSYSRNCLDDFRSTADEEIDKVDVVQLFGEARHKRNPRAMHADAVASRATWPSRWIWKPRVHRPLFDIVRLFFDR